MSFNEQREKRENFDQKAMDNAFSDLISIIKEDNKVKKEEKELITKSAIEDVFKWLGISMPNIPHEMTDINDIVEYVLNLYGIMRRRIELQGNWWKDSTGVLLGSTVDNDVVALIPAFPSGYTFLDPDTGKKVKVNSKTVKRLNIDAFCFYRSLPAKKLSLIDIGLFSLRSVTISDVILILGATLLVSLLGMFLPYMNKQIYNSVIPSGSKSDVFPVGALLVGAAVASSLFGITRSMILSKLTDKVDISVQNATMSRIFALPATFFNEYSSGELASRAMSINQLCGILSYSVLTTVLSALFSFVYIFQMVSYGPSLVVPGLLTVFGMLAFTILTGIIQQKVYKKQMKVSAKLSGLVFGLFNGVQKIKLAASEKRAFAKWASMYKEQGKLEYSPPVFIRINSAISGMITLASSLVLYYFAGINKVSQSDYTAFNTAFGSVSGSIMALAGVATTLANIKPLLDMVKPILEAVPEIDQDKKQVTSLNGNIEISNLNFRYNENGPLVLNNVNIKINKGEYVAVVGKTGSGKSTLMRLCLGFEKPETGAIYYDGYDLDTLNPRSVRQHIGTALQNGKLFSGDIFSNIIITAPWSTLDDAWEAAQLAGIDADIKAMPMGMNTLISEGSGGISGGQRQRLLIARSLVSKPNILLFDEATSALDNITQRYIADNLKNLGCTRIVIAHRLSTVKHCDRIIVIEKGKIVEEGNYDELMAKKGSFYELAIRQIS